MGYTIHESVQKALNVGVNEEAIRTMIKSIGTISNYHGHNLKLGAVYSKYSKFIITALVTYHSESDVCDGSSYSSSEYLIIAEQYINDIQLTKFSQKTTLDRNMGIVTGKHWEVERTSTTNSWIVIDTL